jgi:hypothetical protein
LFWTRFDGFGFRSLFRRQLTVMTDLGPSG